MAVNNVDTLFINKHFHMGECFHSCCLLACGFCLVVTDHVTETGALTCVKSSAIDACNRENLVFFKIKLIQSRMINKTELVLQKFVSFCVPGFVDL